MKLFSQLAGKIDLEPIYQYYYEWKAFWMVHPERVKRAVENAEPGIAPAGEETFVPGRIAFVNSSSLEAKTLGELADRCGHLIAKAIRAGAALVVFPPDAGKLLLCLAPYDSKRVNRRVLEAYQPFWSAMAKKYHIWLLPGYKDVCSRGYKQVVATMFLPDGSFSIQTKTILSSEERRSGYLPGRTAKVWNTGAGKVGICFPGEEQYFELGRIHESKGAQAVICLTPWKNGFNISDVSGCWVRAQENNIYYLTSERLFSPARLTIDGSGLAMYPNSEDEGLVIAHLDLGRLAQVRENAALRQPSVRAELIHRYLPELYPQE